MCGEGGECSELDNLQSVLSSQGGLGVHVVHGFPTAEVQTSSDETMPYPPAKSLAYSAQPMHTQTYVHIHTHTPLYTVHVHMAVCCSYLISRHSHNPWWSWQTRRSLAPSEDRAHRVWQRAGCLHESSEHTFGPSGPCTPGMPS